MSRKSPKTWTTSTRKNNRTIRREDGSRRRKIRKKWNGILHKGWCNYTTINSQSKGSYVKFQERSPGILSLHGYYRPGNIGARDFYMEKAINDVFESQRVASTLSYTTQDRQSSSGGCIQTSSSYSTTRKRESQGTINTHPLRTTSTVHFALSQLQAESVKGSSSPRRTSTLFGSTGRLCCLQTMVKEKLELWSWRIKVHLL